MVSNQLSGRRGNPGTPKVCKIPPEKKWPPPPPPAQWPDGWPLIVGTQPNYYQTAPTFIDEFGTGTLTRTSTPRLYAANITLPTVNTDETWEVSPDGTQARATHSVHGTTPEPNTGIKDWFGIDGWPLFGQADSTTLVMDNPTSACGGLTSWSL